MAELFRHTDEDGDTVTLETEEEGQYTVNVFNLGDLHPRSCVYLDSAALLDFSKAISVGLSFYSLKDITRDGADHG
jgi:hypothetical protein